MGHIWLGLFILWKNKRRVERILTRIFKELTNSEKKFLSNLDKRYFIGPVGVVVLSLPLYIGYLLARLNYKPRLLESLIFSQQDEGSITAKIVENVLMTIFYVTYTFGNAATVIKYYLIVCFIFEGYAMNLASRLNSILEDKVTAEKIREVRDRLRIYYTQKVKAEKFVNVFPFLWLSYLMLTATSYFTKAATDWKQEQQTSETFFVVNVYLSIIYFASTTITSIATERGNNKFKECIQKALALSDPRRKDFPPTQIPPDIKKEILLLHHEMTSRPQTASTVFGMVTFDRGMVLSFVGNLINFAVMVINIRVAFKTSNSHSKVIQTNSTINRQYQ
jgi:hypothetical protein